MLLERLDLSARGRTRIVLWTVLGTLGVIILTLGMDSFNFNTFTPTQLIRAIITDIVLPLVIAPPIFFYFSSKLRELAIAHHKLAIYACTDSLTDVLNRGAFTTLVDAYLGEVRVHEGPSGTLLVIDVDNFKRINDSFGHDWGDEGLKLIAATIRGVLRSVDLVGRMGGEEFGVFLPGTTGWQAEAAAERIRQAVAEATFLPEGRRRSLSVSVGGASFMQRVTFQALYREADRKLYEAKHGGRNRVAFARAAIPAQQAAA
jgi:diguanylate cyclase (GGDEF)-like protein